jgi:hypothetical protein
VVAMTRPWCPPSASMGKEGVAGSSPAGALQTPRSRRFTHLLLVAPRTAADVALARSRPYSLRRAMTVIYDTSSVPVEDRVELWVSASSELFVPLECRPHDGASFRGLLQAGVVGPLALSRLDVSPHTIRRTRTLDTAAPWGGVKAGGWGREMGKDAIDLYTEVKSVWVSLS